MAAKTSAKSAPVVAKSAAVVAPEILPDSTLAVSLAVAAAKPVENPAPVLRLITFDQILVDGKLGGKPADLIARRPELAPAIVDLFRAREAKLLEQHASALSKLSPPV